MFITTLPQSVDATPEMKKVFAAVVNGATTVSDIVEASGVVKARTRAALNSLEANDCVTSARGDKPGQPTIWSPMELTDAEAAQMYADEFDAMLAAEAASVAAEGSQDVEVETEETVVLVDGEVEVVQVPVETAPAAPAELGINQKKQVAARAILKAAGDLVEFWGEQYGDSGVTAAEAAELFTRWLQYTPGADWDIRLGAAPALKVR